MNIQPLSDHVLIEPIKDKEKTESGIILPKTASKKGPEEGKVIAVGPGKIKDDKFVPMAIKVGQKVLFLKYGPNEIKVEGKKYIIVKEAEILAILKKHVKTNTVQRRSEKDSSSRG